MGQSTPLEHTGAATFSPLKFCIILALLLSFVLVSHLSGVQRRDATTRMLNGLQLAHNATSQDRIRMFIAIGSAPGKLLLRQTLRQTWLSWCSIASSLGVDVQYRFFTEETGVTAEEQQKHGDLVFQHAGEGYRGHAQRFFEQVAWLINDSALNVDFFLKIDDDGFLCLPALSKDLHGMPRSQFFWGKFFCEAGRVLADENFMLFSQDVVQWLHQSRHLLRLNPEATFAAHFGILQHVLNLTVLDDRDRMDVQQGWTTHWMQKPASTTVPTQRQAGSFCQQHIWAHHVQDAWLMRRVFAATDWSGMADQHTPSLELGPICGGHGFPEGFALLRPELTSLPKQQANTTREPPGFPVITAGAAYSFARKTTQ